LRRRRFLLQLRTMTIRPVEASDVDAWAAMRARLWPGEEAASLARETRAFISGGPEAVLVRKVIG
jgi:hypothetical protein